MITFKVSLADLALERRNGEAWSVDWNKVLRPFSSEILVHCLTFSADGALNFWVGEERDPFENTSTDRSLITRRYDGSEGVRVQVTSNGSPRILVDRTTTGTSPLYVAYEDSSLFVSWLFDEVALSLTRRVPDIDACRRHIEHGYCQTREQVIKGIYMLWPGEGLTFDSSGLAFIEAEEPRIVQSGTLSIDADACREFLEIVERSMSRQIARSRNPLIEFSGGLDSSCVVLAATKLASRMSSYAVLQRGIVGSQQASRRLELVERFRLNDHVGPADGILPIDSLSRDECRRTPYGDYFREACTDVLDSHPTGPFDVVLTGIGGDELTKENTFGRNKWEMKHVASTSALVSAIGRADMFMRRGIWPVNPFANPLVVNFCRALPAQIRFGRLLNILTLARAGVTDGYLFPRYKEHFGGVLSAEAYMVDYDALFLDSVIFDYGIWPLGKLLQDARDAADNGFSWELISKLQVVAKLDAVLKHYIN